MADLDQTTAPVEAAQATTSEGRAEGAFYTAPDGTAYNSPDELHKAWANFVPKSEYTKKTQTLAQERAELQRQQRDWEAERRKQEERFKRAEEYEMFDKFVNSRPDAYQRWRQEIQQGATANDVRQQLKSDFEAEYGTKLKELEEWRQQQEADAQRQRVFASLKSKYNDFDEASMDELLGTLSEGDPEAIAEALYWSQRGRKSQTEIAEELVEGRREKSEAGLPGKASLGTPRKTKIPAGATIDDMRELGKARYNSS